MSAAVIGQMDARELLEYLIEGDTVEHVQLEQFVSEQSSEGLYLEYKDGKLTHQSNQRKGRQYIREDVSAFANSDGGVLIIGVDESRPRQISPCQRPGGQPLHEWATRFLQDMAPYFSPQPRLQVVEHPEGEILIIAVSRSPGLVPCVESRQHKYFIRIGESTVQAPDYLISDLVLGRRQRPSLDLYLTHVSQQSNGRIVGGFNFAVENLSLVAAEEIHVGMVSWALEIDPPSSPNKHLLQSPDRHLLQYIDAIDVATWEGAYNHWSWSLYHARGINAAQQNRLNPFQGPLTVRISRAYFLPFTDALVTAAIYVIAKSTPPIWFELHFPVSVHLQFPTRDYNLTRKITERPQVAWSSV